MSGAALGLRERDHRDAAALGHLIEVGEQFDLIVAVPQNPRLERVVVVRRREAGVCIGRLVTAGRDVADVVEVLERR